MSLATGLHELSCDRPDVATERIKYEGRRHIKKGSLTAFPADDVAYSAMLSPDSVIPHLMICEIERKDEESISFAVASHDLDDGALDTNRWL